MTESNKTFDEFWLHYLRAHSLRGTRVVHYIAICTAIAVGVYGLWTQNVWLVLSAVLIGYVPSVSSHSLIEKNKPLIPENPIWAAGCGIKMVCLGMTGQLGRDLERAGVWKDGVPLKNVQANRQPS